MSEPMKKLQVVAGLGFVFLFVFILAAVSIAAKKNARTRRPAFSYPAPQLTFKCTPEPLEVEFAIVGKHYNGRVNCGNLFLQTDIPQAPKVTFHSAQADKLYTLMMIDPDGNAEGSWPDPVPPGKNAPVRHWIVGNIPGFVLQKGYLEDGVKPAAPGITRLQPYRAPHIPNVSDRYGLFVFEQPGRIEFQKLVGSIINFDYANFIKKYRLGKPKASNFFIAIYVSASPFSGRPFHGNKLPTNYPKKVMGKGSAL